MLTRYASNKSCLALTAAVRAFKDAREGTELVSGASDAELRAAISGRPRCDETLTRPSFVPQQLFRASKGRPWSLEGGLARENRILDTVRVFTDLVQIVVLPVLE